MWIKGFYALRAVASSKPVQIGTIRNRSKIRGSAERRSQTASQSEHAPHPTQSQSLKLRGAFDTNGPQCPTVRVHAMQPGSTSWSR